MHSSGGEEGGHAVVQSAAWQSVQTQVSTHPTPPQLLFVSFVFVSFVCLVVQLTLSCEVFLCVCFFVLKLSWHTHARLQISRKSGGIINILTMATVQKKNVF